MKIFKCTQIERGLIGIYRVQNIKVLLEALKFHLPSDCFELWHLL